jgi:ribosomal protein S13
VFLKDKERKLTNFCLINKIFVKYNMQKMTRSFKSIYGIGKIKARRLTTFMLKKPQKNSFETTVRNEYSKKRVFYQIFNRLFLDRAVRYFVYLNIKHKLQIFLYSAYRLFQELPQKGQRTKANAHGPKNYNPFFALKMHSENVKEKIKFVYRRKELFLNRKTKQLTEYINQYMKFAGKDEKKSLKKANTKLSTQNYIRNMNLKKNAK